MSGGLYPPGTVEILDPNSPDPLYGVPRYPGHGYRPRPGEDRPALSKWARLSRGQALGKKTNLVFRAGGPMDQRGSSIPMLQIEGDDADAEQILVTLDTPRVVAVPFSQALAQNATNTTGEQDNAQIQSRVAFPGEIVPIAWPPFEAVIEWGVGGTSSRAYVDFTTGQVVSLTASWLRVSVAITSGLAAGISGTTANYVLSAFCGPGYGRTNAHKTIYVGSVPGTSEGPGVESAVFAVPPFAKYAYVVGGDSTASPTPTAATLRFWQSPNRTANVGNFVINADRALSFPIPAGAAYASVINDTNATKTFSILYTLAI